MNIPNKYLLNDYLSDDKIQYYQKLRGKYTKAFIKFKLNLSDYRDKVLDWFFSLSLELRKIVCAIENKRFTNILSKIYSYHKKYSYLKYKILEDEDEPEYNDTRGGGKDGYSMYNRNYKIENRGNINQKYIVIPESFLDEIRFYQCESPIEKTEIYCSYFTLSEKVLKDREMFVNYFEEISHGEYFKSPIKTSKEFESKDAKKSYIQFPNWISDNCDKFFSLSEYIVGAFEQAISVRYVMCHANSENLNEIIKASYLNRLFDQRRELEVFLADVDFKKMFFDFHVADLVSYLYSSQEIRDFVSRKTGEFETQIPVMGWFANPSFFDITDDINKTMRNINEHLCHFSSYGNPVGEFLDFVMYMHFSKVFKYEDFFLRGLFEKIMVKYSEKVTEEISLEDVGETRKKKRKKKKKGNNSETAPVKLGYEDIRKIVDEIINKTINAIKPKEIAKKEKKNKEQKFFLYDTTKHKKKEKEKTNKNSDTKITKQNDITKSVSITSGINSITISSDHLSFHPNSNSTTDDSNSFLLHHNPIYLTYFESLNKDILSYIAEEDSFLSMLREVRLIVKDFIADITKKIYPDSTLSLYGSTLFKLDIESSDLDLSIFTKNKSAALSQLLLFLSTSKDFSNLFDNITPILTASVPVIKLLVNPLKLNNKNIISLYEKIHSSEYYRKYLFDKKEIDYVKIDITLNSINQNQISFIETQLSTYPDIKILVKIFKRLLQLCQLNVSYKGGMGSYCLFLLVYTYVKTSQKKNNVGALLVEFLIHYGTLVDFERTVINPTQKNPFIVCKQLNSFPIIYDPVTMNNVGKSLFKIFEIVNLMNKVYIDINMINRDILNEMMFMTNGCQRKNVIKELFAKYSK